MVTLTAVPQGPVRLRGKAIDKLALNNLAIAADIVRFSAKCLRQIDVLSRSKDNALPGLNVGRYRP